MSNWYPTALVVFAVAFVVAGGVMLYFNLRVGQKVRAEDFPKYRRAMRHMRYDEALGYVDPSGHRDLALMRSASYVLTGIALFGAALVFGPAFWGSAPKPG